MTTTTARDRLKLDADRVSGLNSAPASSPTAAHLARNVETLTPPTMTVEPRTHPRSAIQVSQDHYLGDYLNLPRMITYWYQAKTVRDCGGTNSLEIGLGMGLTTWILRRWGLNTSTLDLDPALRPSVAGDLLNMPFADDSFDTILIAEVLEHLPFDRFDAALTELRRVARRHVIITLPCPLAGIHLGVNVPILEPLFLAFGFRQWSKPRFDGQHYWELDRRGYPKRRVRTHLRDAGFKIAREFRPGLSLYNYFFVLEK